MKHENGSITLAGSSKSNIIRMEERKPKNVLRWLQLRGKRGPKMTLEHPPKESKRRKDFAAMGRTADGLQRRYEEKDNLICHEHITIRGSLYHQRQSKGSSNASPCLAILLHMYENWLT